MSAELTCLNFQHFDEQLYQGQLDNGLTVYLMPKPDYYETFALLSVKFGAIDTTFVPEYTTDYVEYPAGIAHFLEHKMFETEDGGDVLSLFGKLGANANAFTSFNQTAYLFSTVDQALANLTLLQEFVQVPEFTEHSIAKERDIIQQEIEMYQDDPDHLLFTGVLANLYPNSPLAQDILGTRESLAQITEEALLDNFDIFYQPQNMTLFVIGNFDLETTWAEIQASQADNHPESLPIHRYPLPHEPVKSSGMLNYEVAQPKLALGIRGNHMLAPEDILPYKLALRLLFSMLFGWTSKRYQELYEQGKIDQTFNIDIEVTDRYHFVIISADTSEPIALSSQFRRAIKGFEKDSDLSAQHLQMLKNEMYGEFLRSLNHIENVAQRFVEERYGSHHYFDIPDILYTLSLEDVMAYGRQFIEQCEMTDFTIFKK